MISDESLYIQCLQGDEAALEQLVERYQEALLLFIHSIVRDMDDAEELMLDTFARMLISKAYFSGRSSFKTWLFAIGRNLSLKHLRRKRLFLCRRSWEPPPLAGSDSPESDLLRKERDRCLYYAISQLNANYRQTLFLLYFENVSYAQAAQIMQKSEKQIANLAYRSKRALKHLLEERGFSYADYS